MNILLRKPIQQQKFDQESKYDRFSLLENPFPTSPVNKDSKDRRINGEIYEANIRSKEYERIKKDFLRSPQTDPSHPRLGYICDTSYIGRGNGKSAFLVNLIRTMNEEYCLDISNNINKCFAVYVAPEPGGRTKTFDSLVDLLFKAIISSKLIATALATLRLEAIIHLYPEIDIEKEAEEHSKQVQTLNTENWFLQKGIDTRKIMEYIWNNGFLQKVSVDFPLMASRHYIIDSFITEDSFQSYYKELKKGREKLDFIFSDLVSMFLAAEFNGAYIFVDDFERVPDFQSGRQKRDFAVELRSVLLDGPYENAKYGFFNMFLVLHAGVPAIVSEAWSTSGLDQRYPISPKIVSSHLIPFEKLKTEQVILLIRKYLDEYRLDSYTGDPLYPFTDKAIIKIAEASEYNAAKILRTCSTLIEKSLIDQEIKQIDEEYVRKEIEKSEGKMLGDEPSLDDLETTDLIQKAAEGR